MAILDTQPDTSMTKGDDRGDSEVDELDDEILEIRAQIKALTQRKSLLAATLLNSSRVQSQLRSTQSNHTNTNTILSSDPTSSTENLKPLLAASSAHSQSNIHRLSFGVTSFPFIDPSPEAASNKNLLGIRFDIPSRHGSFHTPYYILLRRLSPSGKDVRIHRHTIPAFIPLQQYEEQYLSQLGSNDIEADIHDDEHRTTNGGAVAATSKKQDLHGLVAKVRHDLSAWHLRRDALDQVCEELNLPPATSLSPVKSEPTNSNEPADHHSSGTSTQPKASPKRPKHNLSSLTLVSNDALQARLIWTDASVGRLKISPDGIVLRAVIIGSEGRMPAYERVLCSYDEDSSNSNVSSEMEDKRRRRSSSANGSVNGGGPSRPASGDLKTKGTSGGMVRITDLPGRLKIVDQLRWRDERKREEADEAESAERGDEEADEDDEDGDGEQEEGDETGVTVETDRDVDGDTTMQT